MRDLISSRRGMQAAQRFLHFLAGSTHVTTFRLLWLALLFYGERVVFHNAATRCRWPEAPASSSSRVAVHVLLVTDPQIIDRDTYPDLPRFLYPIVRHFSDNYLKNAWTSLAINPNKWLSRGYVNLPDSQENKGVQSTESGLVQPPDGVVWIGDLTDGGRRGRSQSEWEGLVKRFHNIFWRPREADWEALPSTLSSTRQLVVPRRSATDFIPTFYLSGNHDIGLPGTSSGHRVDTIASDDAVERFNKDFGMKIDGGGFVVKDRNSFLQSSLNGRVLISLDPTLGATHELILVNAQDLVGMERQGGGPFDTHLPSDHPGKLDGQLGDNAHTVYKATYDFVELVKRSGIHLPRVLFSHVPLHRPAEAKCDDAARSSRHGLYRESSRPLHQGTDRGSTYQNMLSSTVTDWLLASIDPLAVFSGDDHDHCEFRHARVSKVSNTTRFTVQDFRDNEIPELTVKSVSMTEGVRRPGFARLSLFSPPPSSLAKASRPSHVSIAYTPCQLPDQVGIWTHLYLPFFVVTLVALKAWPSYFKPSAASTQGYLPLNNQHKRDDDDGDDPPLASDRTHATTPAGRPKSTGWRHDIVAVAIVALPFWLFCQTHFLF